MPYTTLSSSSSSPHFHRLHLLHDDTTLADITLYNRPTAPRRERVRAAGYRIFRAGCVWFRQSHLRARLFARFSTIRVRLVFITVDRGALVLVE
ncbi:hypothetical protein Tco_1507100 [Tanacetum coccineum]